MGNESLEETLSDPEHLSHLQHECYDRLAKVLVNHKKSSDSRRTKSYFEMRLKSIDQLRTEFENRHRLIIQSDIETTHDYFSKDLFDKFEEVHLEVFCEINEAFIKKFPPTPLVSTTAPTTSVQAPIAVATTAVPLRAPRFASMPMPEFSGNYIDWPAFHDSFVRLVHANPEIEDKLDKFYLLKQALHTTSDNDIRDMPLTVANYDIAWESVIKRYKNDRALFTHFMSVFSLQSRVTKENASELKNLVDTSRKCLNALKQLSIPVDDCDQIFTHFLVEKLPASTQQAWEQSLGKSTEIPSFDTLADFLSVRYRSLEAVQLRAVISDTSRNYSVAQSKPQNGPSKVASKITRVHHAAQSNESSSVHCALCSGQHILRKCQQFHQKSSLARKQFVDKTSLCSNCLSSSHVIKSCTSTRNCQLCGKRHHTLLHQYNETPSQPAAASNSNQTVTQIHNHIRTTLPIVSHVAKFHSAGEVLLPTAVVKLTTEGEPIYVRALVDQGSTGALVSERICQLLNLKRYPIHSIIKGPNQQRSSGKSIVHVNFQSRLNDSTFHVYASVVKCVTSNLPTKTLTYHEWPHIRGLELADPNYHCSSPIELLIGSDTYGEIILDGLKKGEPHQPIAQQTLLGWMISGKAYEKPSAVPSSPIEINCSHVSLEQLDFLVKQFYAIESIPSEHQFSSEENWCRDFYARTTTRQSNGKYLVRLPLRALFDPSQTIGKTAQMAMTRFHQLERKLKRHPEVDKQYRDEIQTYFDLNQIEPVCTTEETHLRFIETNRPSYTCSTLPHHAVIREDSLTTKCRVVFDASAKSSNGKSLNDILCTGPALQNELPAVLLNWRLPRYVITADITKMYRCIDMHDDDAEYQRIIWFNSEGQHCVYKLTTATFGTACAPYIAIETLHRIAQDEHDRYPLAVDVLKNQMYVDDVYTGSHTIEDTIAIRDQTRSALHSAGMKLHKWASNSAELLVNVPIDQQSNATALELNSNETLKTLGMRWQPSNDSYRYKLNFELAMDDSNITKRTVLSTTAKLYDPMGLINPVIVVAKIFIKQLWSRNLDWDDQLPSDLRHEWLNILKGFNAVNDIQIPRWLHHSPNVKRVELHTFCDGSSAAYAAVAYLRIEDEYGNFHVNLIAAKSKVTPKPPITIPRIELCAAVLGLKVTQWITKHLSIPTDTISVYYWVDATIVLSWIRGDINRWPTFVANRIGMIHSASHVNQWHHVATHENPADIVSRGITSAQLIESKLYWNGPPWLSQAQNTWPVTDWTFLEDETIEQHVNVSVNTVEDSILCKYSSFSTLRRVIALALRFLHNCKAPKDQRRSGPCTATELQTSLYAIVRIVQRECFSSEIKAISRNESVPNKSVLTSLTPFIDNNNILRVLGRNRHSRLSYNQRHPIILPKTHHFTNLIIDHAHFTTLHGGPTLMSAYIRKRFWIVHAQRVLTNRFRACVKCAKVNPKPTQQLMGDLPMHRVIASIRPFVATGVDYTGAFELKASRFRGNTTYKGYIAVFICLATKAIHLEVVTGMDTYSFLCALDRFIGRRGKPHDIYSDCGTNFVGADKVLKSTAIEFERGISRDIAPLLADDGIQWHFNPPYSPNFGGIWEANVKAVKRHLYRAFSGAPLTYEEFSTVLSRIESCLNSRPICPLNTNTDDLEVITPGHFLIGDALLASPEPPVTDLTPTRRYYVIQRIIQQFWKRWSTDWLSHLQSRPKWARQHENLRINDMVVVKDDLLPPNKWKLGRIVEIHPGPDGLVRVVTVKTMCGTYKRCISKICKLPVQNNSSEEDHHE